MYGMHALRSVLGKARAFRPGRTIATLLALTAALVALAPGTGATDTNVVTQLTADPTNCSYGGAISADGSVVAFGSRADLVTGQNADHSGEIFVVNSDGTGLAQLTGDPAYSSYSPSISGDGSMVVFCSQADFVTGQNADHSSEVFVVNSDGTGLRQLTVDPVSSSSLPAVSADGSVVVFVSRADLVSGQNADHFPEVFVINSDGTGLRQLTADPSYHSVSPAISADGSVVAFFSWADLVPGQNTDHSAEIFVVNSDGTGLRQLTAGPGLDSRSPHISGDGSLVTFSSAADLVPGGNPDGSREAFVVNSDGTGLRQLTSESDAAASVEATAISCDGTVIALSYCASPFPESQVHIVNSDGTGLRPVVRGPGCAWPGSISGDGSVLTVETCAPLVPGGNPGGQSQVYLVDVGVLPFVQLTADLAYDTWFVRVSGDGSVVAFQSMADLVPGGNADHSWEVFVANSDGTGLLQLTNDAAYGSGPPVMSADGSVVAFQSTADLVTGQNADHWQEIFVVNSDGTGLLQLTADPSYASASPGISADGSVVAFHSEADLVSGQNADHSLEIFVVNSDGTGLRQLTADPSYHSMLPAISADGSMVVFQSYADLVTGQNADHLPEVFIVNSDGTGLRQLTADPAYGSASPLISGDGSVVAFRSYADLVSGGNADHSAEVFVVNSDGTGLRQITSDVALDTALTGISADGAAVVFAGCTAGSPAAFIVNSDGTGLRHVAGVPGVCTYPGSLSGDGSVIGLDSRMNLVTGGNMDENSDGFVVSLVGSASTMTAAGADVTVEPMEGVSVTYEAVATAEETMVEYRAALTPPVPSEYTPVSDYHAVRTRADYTGPVTVELAYDPAEVAAAGGRTEQLRALHLSPLTGRWEDVTETVDAANEVVIAEVNNLSWFVISLSPYAVVSDFAATPTSGVVPLTVDFTDQSLAAPTSWLWSFGDGETSTEQDPSHEYQTPGRYAVSLTATNAGGSDGETKAKYITVRFTDVAIDTWGYAEIMAGTDAGIISGYGDGSYNPGWAVTRDQMAAYIARAVCTPMGEAGLADYVPPATPSFTDVATDYWTYKHIEYVVEQSIVEGYGDNTYHPTDVLDRAQMAVFIARSIVTPTGEAGLAGYTPPATPTFDDVQNTGYGTDGTEPFWAYKHIEYIAGEGIAGGYEDQLYHPEYVCSRDQMAVYIFRAFELPL